MNLGRILVLAALLAVGATGESWAAGSTGAGGWIAFLRMSGATLCFLFVVSLPWLFLRLIETRSGDPLWLYHKVFGDSRP